MPELPEVETTRRGISSALLNQTIASVNVRQARLRVPVTPELNALCAGRTIFDINRRAKYLLLQLSEGTILIHLGMSGHLRVIHSTTEAGKHDHIDLCLANGTVLRFNDPRRFGLWIYIKDNPSQHPLLAHLGPEPLSDAFNGEYLTTRAQRKTQRIKSFIMNNKVVVGVGNIYATECLFLAGIHPQTPAGAVPQEKLMQLSRHIKTVLQQAIDAGGTTLRDFYAADGKPGYFANDLKIYGRKGEPCYTCRQLIETVTIAGRSSTFCPQCQDGGLQTKTHTVSSTY